MIRNILSAVALIALTLWTASANAALTITDVSYTSNSVTFTINGDMSGYQSQSIDRRQFSLVYGGDIWAGDTTFEPNSWSRPVFDNKSFQTAGNTGNSGNNYTWSEYTTELTDAVVVNATVTITMTEADLDENASNPQITFVWGNGSNPDFYTVLATVGDFDDVEYEPVPSLSTWALLLLTLLFGLVAVSNRKRIF